MKTKIYKTLILINLTTLAVVAVETILKVWI